MLSKCKSAVFYAFLIAVASIGVFGGMKVGANESNLESADEVGQANVLPYFVKYGILVGSYADVFGAQLSGQLSPKDSALLENLAATNPDWEANENVRYHAELVELCSNRAGKDVVDLAAEYDAIAASSNQRRASRYREAMDSLSAEGRARVDQFVEVKIVANTSVSSPDISTLPFATTNPEAFQHLVDNECHRILYGSYLPEYEAALEEDAELAKARMEKALRDRIKQFKEETR